MIIINSAIVLTMLFLIVFVVILIEYKKNQKTNYSNCARKSYCMDFHLQKKYKNCSEFYKK